MDKFQSTLPRGERQRSPAALRPPARFQSTLPRGERLNDSPNMATFVLISIHAPARGATSKSFPAPLRNPDFNPRSREGATQILRHVQHQIFVFQSTLPRGERPLLRTKVRPYTKFQSTLPRGERLQPARERSRSQKFQSTLPRGERPPFEALNVPYIEFQSTLPRGERLNNGGNAGLAYEFQSTLPRGERLSG